MHGFCYADFAPPADANSITSLNESNAVAGGCPREALRIDSMQNLLPLTDESQKFGHGRSNPVLRRLMGRLAARLASTSDWSDDLGTGRPNDNPAIPAGYTYLLQLVAHDVVASSLSLAVTNGQAYGLENARVQPLLLSTIYGSGPDTDPGAYEFSELVSRRGGHVPRTRLRIGKSRDGQQSGSTFDDIGRATAQLVADGGLVETDNKLLTEALISDPRNDDHALISQLTVLFHQLHNHVIDRIELPSEPSANRVYLNFICARSIVTLLYRTILLRDVLKRLLHPAVYAHYVSDQGVRLTKPSSVPLEFALGAFRCGHAMVRDDYKVNTETPQRTQIALQLSSLRTPAALPVDETWIIHWDRFFELPASQVTPNFSRRLGPKFAGVVRLESLFPAPMREIDRSGLPSRDLASAVYVPLWSVPALHAEIRKNATFANLLPDYEQLRLPIRNWLASDSGSILPGLEPGDAEVLADDPPLPFFVLFEAACTNPTAANPADSFNGGGRHLGPLGSIITAETILGLMETTHDDLVGNDCALGIFDGLGDQIARVCQLTGVQPEIFEDLHHISSMPELLAALPIGRRSSP